MKRVFITILALTLSAYTLLTFIHFFEIKRWGQTEGVISHIESESKMLKVKYVYVVRAEEYIGYKSLASILPFPLSVEDHNSFVSKLAVGDSCDVYYNPKYPDEATLARRYSMVDLVVASVMLIPIGVYLVLKLPVMQSKV